MIDYARPTYESYELYHPAPAPPARLDDFQVFKKSTPFMYANYYTNPANDYGEAEIGNATQVYQNLVNSTREYRDDWRFKYVFQWTEDDSMSWLVDTMQQLGCSEFDVPVYNFRVSGIELREMKREQVAERMAHVNLDPAATRRVAEAVFQRLEARLQEEEYRHSAVLRYVDAEFPPHETHSVLDLDAFDKGRQYAPDYKPADASVLQAACDSSDDADDIFRNSANASPDCEGSDVSKSGDEDDKRKIFKRPPGRPKGTGRKVCKRPRSVSVPEFLRNLLLDPEYCPSIIKWEDRSVGKFRFVKPDEVAKLWGKMKQNDNMTFEKFSRAMRYHYRQSVLVSVPTARLVYQFGHKGPEF